MTGVIVVGEPDLSDVVAAAPISAAGTDQAAVLAMSGLGGRAALGWTLAILQRRRDRATGGRIPAKSPPDDA